MYFFQQTVKGISTFDSINKIYTFMFLQEREREKESNGWRYILHDDILWKLYFCQKFVQCIIWTMYHFVLYACTFPDALSCCPKTTSIVSGEMLKAIQQQWGQTLKWYITLNTTKQQQEQWYKWLYYAILVRSVYSSMICGLRETKEIYIIQYIVKHILFQNALRIITKCKEIEKIKTIDDNVDVEKMEYQLMSNELLNHLPEIMQYQAFKTSVFLQKTVY